MKKGKSKVVCEEEGDCGASQVSTMKKKGFVFVSKVDGLLLFCEGLFCHLV